MNEGIILNKTTLEKIKPSTFLELWMDRELPEPASKMFTDIPSPSISLIYGRIWYGRSRRAFESHISHFGIHHK